jgi:disulfide bond formation protein DsbB
MPAGSLIDDPRRAALAVLVVAAATIAGALFFEHVLGYLPCPLCLDQRIPYYVGMPVAGATALAAYLRTGGRLAAIGFVLLALIFLVSAGLGIYHAGVEWHFWPGPESCAAAGSPSGSMDDFLKRLNQVRVVSCTDAAWRLFGISLAGWNALISLVLAAVAAMSATRTFRRIAASAPA